MPGEAVMAHGPAATAGASHSTVLALLTAAAVLGRSPMCCADSSAPPGGKGPTIEDVEETLGPFVIGERTFRVVVHQKRLVWPTDAKHIFDPDDDETATYFDVRDAEGHVVYTEKHDREITLADVQKEGRFGWSDSVSAALMEGTHGRALWISEATLPSAPDACSTHTVLGLFDGKLVPFSEPFCAHIVDERGKDKRLVGNVLRLVKGDRADNEIFEVREREAWGNFSVLIPVRVDFLMAKLRPAHFCRRAVGPAQWDELCEFKVEAERVPEPGETFVRLFPEPYPDRIPQHVVVRAESKVEFVSALARNVMSADGKWLPELPEGDPEAEASRPWLQVIVDGKRG